MSLLRKTCFSISCAHLTGARALSTVPSREKTDRYVKQRKLYEEEMSQLKKTWTKEFEERAELARRRAAAEKQRIQLQKAKRYRVKREESMKRVAAAQKRREEALERWRAHMARAAVLREESRALQQQTYQNLLAGYANESPVWVTDTTVETLITPNFFSNTPTTTGFLTRESDYWRYYTEVWDHRRPHKENLLKTIFPRPDLMDVVRQNAERRAQYRLFVADMLKNSAVTGEDRERLDEIVDVLTKDVYETEGGDLLDPFGEQREKLLSDMARDTSPLASFVRASTTSSPLMGELFGSLGGKNSSERAQQSRKQDLQQMNALLYCTDSGRARVRGETKEEEEEDESLDTATTNMVLSYITEMENKVGEPDLAELEAALSRFGALDDEIKEIIHTPPSDQE